MNLYLISQKDNSGYDTYDSAVVAAESDEAAKIISPCGSRTWDQTRGVWLFGGAYEDEHSSWTHPDNVSVKLIGTAVEGTDAGVVVASFNAG